MLVDLLKLALENLRSPMILCFFLGVGAALSRSDLEVPPALAKGLSIYLLFAIGFKGGVSLAEEGAGALATAMPAAIALSFALPFAAYALLRGLSPLDRSAAAAVAAHYGSISVVTFVTAVQFLEERTVRFEGVTLAMAAAMESPAIVAGLLLAGRGQTKTTSGSKSISRQDFWNRIKLLRRTMVHGSVVLLLGSFAVGALSSPQGRASVEPFIKGGFKGALCLFLLDMGLIAVRSGAVGGERASREQAVGPALIGFALYMPLLGGCCGLGLGRLLGFGVGGQTLVAVLGSSASYIAVPAAMRMALPRVRAALYLTAALGITFPFNVTLGIPLYYFAARGL